MEISKGVQIVDLGLKIGKALVITDLHLGYEEALNKQGVMVPRFQFKDLVKRLHALLEKTNPELVIVNGDIKHEFGRISDQEWREALKIIDMLMKNSKVILIKGNHDKILGPIAKKRDLEIVDHYQLGDILILHGHEETKIPKDAKRIIIGHDHPAISLREGLRQETYKCFLKGKYNRKELIVQPSFNLITEGADVIKEDFLSPFLQGRIDDFEVYIISDKVYDFGKIKEIKKLG